MNPMTKKRKVNAVASSEFWKTVSSVVSDYQLRDLCHAYWLDKRPFCSCFVIGNPDIHF